MEKIKGGFPIKFKTEIEYIYKYISKISFENPPQIFQNGQLPVMRKRHHNNEIMLKETHNLHKHKTIMENGDKQ